MVAWSCNSRPQEEAKGKLWGQKALSLEGEPVQSKNEVEPCLKAHIAFMTLTSATLEVVMLPGGQVSG